MAVMVLVGFLCLAGSILVGMVVVQRVRVPGGGPSVWGPTLARRFGAIPAALGVAVVGWVVSIALTLPVGLIGRATEDGLDRPILDWVYPRVQSSAFTKANTIFTIIGDRPVNDLVMLVAGVILGFAYGRRWWVPVVAILGIWLLQRQGQLLLAKLVDRHPPPVPAGGFFPSGGISRILSIYGVIILLSAWLIPTLSRRWRMGLWIGLATLAVMEADTRIYLSRHWLTDALAGFVFGMVLLPTGLTAIYSMMTMSERPVVEMEQARLDAARRS